MTDQSTPTPPPPNDPLNDGQLSGPSNKKWLVPTLIAAVVVLALIAGGAIFALGRSTGQPTPAPSSSAPTSASPSTPSDQVAVTLTIGGCDDCTVTANWSAFSSTKVPANPWTSGPLKFSGGETKFTVPAQYTSGLSFEVNSPRNTDAQAVPIAVVHYSNVPTGQPVTGAEATASTTGYGCWAGTSDAEVTLDLLVDWVPGKSLEGKAIQELRAYFSPGLLTVGDAFPTSQGMLGHQNVWSCFG